MRIHLLDVGVWLALAVSTHQHHGVATAWLDEIDEVRSLRFCRTTQQSFLRLLTNAAVLGAYGVAPLSNEAAWDAYEALLADGRVATDDTEPASLERHWRGFSSRDSASTKLWTDAYLAAFAFAAGYRLITTDAGYRQFSGLDLVVLEDG